MSKQSEMHYDVISPHHGAMHDEQADAAETTTNVYRYTMSKLSEMHCDVISPHHGAVHGGQADAAVVRAIGSVRITLATS